MPVSAFALQELTEATKRADNANLLAALPSQVIPRTSILEALDVSRGAR